MLQLPHPQPRLQRPHQGQNKPHNHHPPSILAPPRRRPALSPRLPRRRRRPHLRNLPRPPISEPVIKNHPLGPRQRDRVVEILFRNRGPAIRPQLRYPRLPDPLSARAARRRGRHQETLDDDVAEKWGGDWAGGVYGA